MKLYRSVKVRVTVLDRRRVIITLFKVLSRWPPLGGGN